MVCCIEPIYPPSAIALRFRFLDENKQPVDPPRVAIALKQGNAAHTFVFGTNDNLTKERQGVYRLALQFLPLHAGIWKWHVEAGDKGDGLVPVGNYLKSACGELTVLEPEVEVNEQ